MSQSRHPDARIKELAEKVIAAVGSSSELIHLPPLAEGDMRRRCPDNSKMLALLGREPLSLEEGLGRTVEFLKSQDS